MYGAFVLAKYPISASTLLHLFQVCQKTCDTYLGWLSTELCEKAGAFAVSKENPSIGLVYFRTLAILLVESEP